MTRETVIILNIVLALVLIGVLMVYSASTVKSFSVNAEESSVHPFHYLFGQLLHVGLGLICLIVAARFDYHHYRKKIILLPILLGVVGLLALVLEVGIEINNARRWLPVGPYTVQPSDFAKIASVLALSVMLAGNQRHITKFFRGFLPPMIVAGVLAGLIAAEPDIGTPAVIGTVAMLLALMAGVRLIHLFLAMLPALAFVGAYIMKYEHAWTRITSYRNPWEYRLEGGWQLTQSLWAFAQGGVFGRGPGASQTKLHYLPFADSDFIFAVWGEEMGLVGTLAVVLLFVLFFVLAMRIAVCAPDLLGSLLAAGVASTIALQAGFNMGVTTGILPTKGLTLPFISAGGTATIVYMTMVGILVNVGMQATGEERSPGWASDQGQPAPARG